MYFLVLGEPSLLYTVSASPSPPLALCLGNTDLLNVDPAGVATTTAQGPGHHRCLPTQLTCTPTNLYPIAYTHMNVLPMHTCRCGAAVCVLEPRLAVRFSKYIIAKYTPGVGTSQHRPSERCFVGTPKTETRTITTGSMVWQVGHGKVDRCTGNTIKQRQAEEARDPGPWSPCRTDNTWLLM